MTQHPKTEDARRWTTTRGAADAASRPRRCHSLTPALLLALALALAAGACRGGDAQALFERSQGHLERAAEILDEHKGDGDAALAALAAYRKEHEEEILDARRRGAEAVGAMSSEQRQRFLAETRPATERLLTRVMNALRSYENRAALRLELQKFR